MINKIYAIRGMNDIFFPQTMHMRNLEEIFVSCILQYNYKEIRFPIIEKLDLFKQSIGTNTDILTKEMYTFFIHGSHLALRPEGTSSCIRACLEHGLLRNKQNQKLWYIGPMFRHEKPQKGRYRQFYQFGVEALGITDLTIEIELLSICKRIWRMLNIEQHIHLQINTLGTIQERNKYEIELKKYLKHHLNKLDDNSKNTLDKNPLRILDSKQPNVKLLLKNAPKLLDFLDNTSKNYFNIICDNLNNMGISYTINPFLVRGLNYYTYTVFEWVTNNIGSQNTICAGGRYDVLSSQLGKYNIPAIGFAIGIDRLLLLLETLDIKFSYTKSTSLFIIYSNEKIKYKVLLLAESIRNINKTWKVTFDINGGSFKNQLKRANKNNFEYAIIIGEKEIKNKQITIKNLHKRTRQITIPYDTLLEYLKKEINKV